jgi:hypothetical protein
MVVLLVPPVIEGIFPNRRNVLELTAVTLPIAAFFWRFFAGKRHIDSNRCATAFRYFQLFALCVGILFLLLIDSFVILAHEMPKGAMLATETDRIVWAVLASVYLTCMAVAMYPGRTEPGPVEWCDYDPFTRSG